MDLRESIRGLIAASGMKQKVVAERAGMSEAVFSNIVRGRRKVYADEVEGLAKALGVSIEELFAQSEDAG